MTKCLFLMLSLLALQVASRRKMVSKRKREDPPFCSKIQKPCSDLHMKECPLQCGALDAEIEGGQAVKMKRLVIDLTDDTRPQDRLKLAKTPGFKKIWPHTCDGHNVFKEKISISTNGFSCHPGNHRVAEIYSMRWLSKEDVCCAGECRSHYQVGSSCDPKSLASAARTSALGVSELVTEKGQKVDVSTVVADTEETKETGLIATVEVRMVDGVLTFQSGRPNLTEAGETFLNDLGEPLSALLSMQLTGARGSYVRMLFCPHGSSTATIDRIYDKSLPEKRAQVVGEALKKLLPEGVVSVGKAIGHFKREDGKFIGGRFGSIIYKVHDADVKDGKLVTCKREDMYQFMQHLEGMKHLHEIHKPKRPVKSTTSPAPKADDETLAKPKPHKPPNPEEDPFTKPGGDDRPEGGNDPDDEEVLGFDEHCDNPMDLPVEEQNQHLLEGFPDAMRAPPAEKGSLDLEQKKYDIGDTIKWACPIGYKSHGAPVSICDENGIWNNPQAVCTPYHECSAPCDTCIPVPYRRGKHIGKDCKTCVHGYLLLTGESQGKCVDPKPSFTGVWGLDSVAMKARNMSFPWLDDKKFELWYNKTWDGLELRVHKFRGDRSEPRSDFVRLRCRTGSIALLTCDADYTYKSIRIEGTVFVPRSTTLRMHTTKHSRQLKIIANDRLESEEAAQSWGRHIAILEVRPYATIDSGSSLIG